MTKDDDLRAALNEQQSEAEEALSAARKTPVEKRDVVSGEEDDPAEDETSQFGGDSGGQPTGS